MVCDTWLYILLLIHYKHYSSRFVLTLKSVGTNLLSVSIRGMLKNHEDIWLPNHREAATLRRGHPRWDVAVRSIKKKTTVLTVDNAQALNARQFLPVVVHIANVSLISSL